MALRILTIQQAKDKACQNLVGAEGDLYEYEYGCIEHALEHMKVKISCASCINTVMTRTFSLKGALKTMTRADINNLVYSCLIDGTGSHEPITLAEATYTLQCWKDEGIIYDGLTPEAFMLAWNDVLEELSPD